MQKKCKKNYSVYILHKYSLGQLEFPYYNTFFKIPRIFNQIVENKWIQLKNVLNHSIYHLPKFEVCRKIFFLLQI